MIFSTASLQIGSSESCGPYYTTATAPIAQLSVRGAALGQPSLKVAAGEASKEEEKQRKQGWTGRRKEGAEGDAFS